MPLPSPHAAPYLVFLADDWGRHPSSAQHLARRLIEVEGYGVEWIHTLGLRTPKLRVADVRRGLEKVGEWAGRAAPAGSRPPGLRVHAPRMLPSYRGRFARRHNTTALLRTLRAIEDERGAPPVAVVSTVPTVADLARVRRDLTWVHYRVDSFAEWEGLDSVTLRALDRAWLPLADLTIAASERLAEEARLIGARGPVHVLTHGVDREHWRVPPRTPAGDHARAPWTALHWGAIDERIDVDVCRRLAENGRLILAGPHVGAPPALRRLRGVELLGPVPFHALPELAAGADVLVMPYRVGRATNSLQPLKLKEYMATGLPAVVADLPSVGEWRDAVDVVRGADAFVARVRERAAGGLPESQGRARERLAGESWKERCARFARIVEGPRTPRPLRVLHVRACAGSGSGPEKTLLRTPAHARRHGVEVTLAILRDPGDAAFATVVRQARERGVDLIEVDDRGPFDRTVLPRLLEIVDVRGIDVWHGHDFKSNWLGARAQRVRPGLRLFATSHGWVHRTARTPLYDRLDRRVLRRYERVIAVSEAVRTQLVRSGVAPERVTVVPNGVDADELERAEPLVAPGVRVGAVGRLAAEKGLDLLIDACVRARAHGADLTLDLFGEGPERAALEARIVSAGAVGWARLRGFRRDRRALFSELDVFALPSLREGTPNALLEAMAAGLPIVASRIDGVRELVRDAHEALLVDPGDVGGLTAALLACAEDRRAARRRGAAARTRALRDFSLTARMDAVFGTYAPPRPRPRTNTPLADR